MMVSRYAYKRYLIEQEYGLPFREVVRGFAQDGESANATATILGYSAFAFYRLLEREGMRHWFPADGRCGCAAVNNRERLWGANRHAG